MCTKSNPEKHSFSEWKRKIVITLVSLVTTMVSIAQINPVMVKVTVMPPYTSSISDYMTIPNKIMITLYRNVLDYPAIDLYLKVSIESDNGVKAFSEEGYKPNFPITLENGALPYTVNIDNLSDAFNLQHIVIEGTTLNDLLNGAGLPEGNYQICVRAFDFNTGLPLSDEAMGCSNTFTITNLEPPMFQSPICGDPQICLGPQMVNVSWSKPALSPFGTTYHFEMVEIPENVTIDPNEAFLTSKFPVLYEETLSQTMLPLTVDKVSLNPGYTYVMRVTAEDPNNSVHFRNGGTSEVCWFNYKTTPELNVSNLINNDSIDFVFINPSEKTDTLLVNNENSLLLNWCWIKKTNTGTILADNEIINGYDLQKYILTIEKTSKAGAGFSISKEFTKIDSTGLIQNYQQLSKAEASDAGFEDGATYKAIINVFNSSNQLVRTAESHEFVFKIIKDEVPAIKVPVQAVINYGYKNYPDIFPVNNSEVIIEALIAQNSKSLVKQQSKIFSKNKNGLPSELLEGDNFVKIASVVAKTNEFGQLDSIIEVPEHYFESDSVAFRIKLANKYYVDKDFKPLYLKKSANPIALNFGILTAKTYAYTLKLNVKKEFTSYKIVKNESGVTVSMEEDGTSGSMYNSSNKTGDQNQTYTYQVGKDTVAEGIPVVLYRVDKPENIPVYEGDLNQSNPPVKDAFTDITIVAFGTTSHDNDSTFVTFNKLLATNNKLTEAYKILAIPNLSALLGPTKTNLSSNVSLNKNSNTSFDLSLANFSGLTPDLSNLLTGAIKNLEENSSLTNFVDSGKFIAEEMIFSLDLPKNLTDENAYYRTVSADYTIKSCTPPTSKIKGRLLYEWISDSKKVKRALTNTHFRVIVDYVDGAGKSIGAISNNVLGKITGHWESNAYQKEGSNEVIPLVDQYATMGEGVTDNDGNFSIDVVNFNEKGNLGSGSLLHSEGSSKPPVVGQSLEDKLKEQLGGDGVINPNPYESLENQFGNDMNSQGTQQNVGIQNSLNGNNFNVGFDAGNQSFELDKVKGNAGSKTFGMINPTDYSSGKNAHGPYPDLAEAPSGDASYTSTEYNTFRRTFRIVVDGDNAPFYYPSRDVIEIQPFESNQTPYTITHYVKEFKLQVQTAELNMNKETVPVSQLQVTVYRHLNDKPEHLPLGEGNGKYTYSELVSPLYNNGSSNGDKYEQLWPLQEVNDVGMTTELYGLLQSEYKKYLVQASSFVNKGQKAYQETANVNIPEVKDTIIDWVNPIIPLVKETILLTPAISRALVMARDSFSNQPLTSSRNTRAILSKTSFIPFFLNSSNTAAIDQYGYVELFADKPPLSNFNIQKLTPTEIYFSASSVGYKTPTPYQKASFVSFGYQATPRLALIPAAILKGKVIDADGIKAKNSSNVNNLYSYSTSIINNGVEAYIQADSGLVVETKDQFGNFEMPVAPKAGVKIIIRPKDIAWFDTTIVLTASDEKKQIIDLDTVKLYRRKHRIQFNISQKMNPGFVGPATPVSGATIQLGQDIVTTASNGSAKFLFENVSVNNYTFIVKGSLNGGYIPKTVNVKNSESREYQQIYVELEKGSEITGIVKLDGKPVKNAKVYIEVNNTSTPSVNTNYSLQPQNSSQKQNQPQLGIPNSQVNNIQIQSGANNFLNGTNQASGSITDDANLVVARTDAQGKYKLQGVPVNNQKINIIATLDTTFTVSGDKQQANIVNGHAQTDLNLKSFGDAIVNKLFGFPLTIEKITSVNPNQIKVTGLVHWTEAISDFTLKDNIIVLRVEDVLYDLVKNGTDPASAVAHENSVNITGITSLKLSYIDKYNVKLTSAEQQLIFNTSPLRITKEDDHGKIGGRIQIVDNSFNYPNSYLNFTGSEFYLAKLNLPDSSINNKVSVATSAFSVTESLNQPYQKTDNYRKAVSNRVSIYKQQPVPVYNLCSKDAGPVTFKLINFVATANPKKSFIDKEGKIHLNTRLECHIPHAQPEDISVLIPDIVLDENKINPVSSSKPINVKLEEWNLEAHNWTFSTDEGGIVSTNALLRTKIIDIPVGKFVLRSDMFFMDDYKLQELSMAGGKFKLQNIKQGSAHLNYEYKVGTDMKPHWNFSLLGSGTTSVATLPPLQGMPWYNIDLNYIEILSNNEMVVQLMQKPFKPFLLNNKVAQFEPLAIYNGPTYIGVSGLLNTGAPRMSGINLTANWTSVNENPTFENVETDFEAKGFVHFEANKQKISITPDLLTIEGRVLEKPERTFNPLPATFIAKSNVSANPRYEVVLKNGWITQLNDNEPDGLTQPLSLNKGYRLEIESGGMKVANNDWTTLTYSGTMKANEKNTDNVADSKVNFEVLGDVSANSDQMNIGTSTPFGAFNTCYDFKNKELRGSLLVDVPSGITLGSVIVYKGAIGTCFGANGFYIAGGMKAFLPMGILAGIYNLGMMAGYHEITPELWGITNSCINPMVVNNCYKTNTPFLSGFYFAFNREVLNKSITKDFILASGYIRANALLGGDFYINYLSGDSWKVGADGFVFVDIGAGLDAITGTSISGNVTGDGRIGFAFGQPDATNHFYTSIGLGFSAKIEQELGIETISESISVDCSIKGDTNSGLSFSLSSDGKKPDCNVEPENQ